MFQLVDSLLWLVLPDWLYEQKHDVMFPVSWHQYFNYMWFTQSLVCMIWCIFNGRIMPSSSIIRPKSLFFRQFRLLLVTHSVFYYFELTLTSIWTGYTVMAFHHLFACVLFAIMYVEESAICGIGTIPYVLHGFYWILGANSDELLSVYNWTFLFVGLVSIWHLTIVEKRLTSYKLPLLCVLIVAINNYNYCRWFHGYYCPSLGFVLDKFTELIIILGIQYGAAVAFVYNTALKRKAKNTMKLVL